MRRICFSILLALIASAVATTLGGCGGATMGIGESDIPYRHSVTLQTGDDVPFGADAAKFVLPDGQLLAVWIDAEKVKKNEHRVTSNSATSRVDYGSDVYHPDYYATVDDIRSGNIKPPDDPQAIVVGDFKMWVGEDRRHRHDEWIENYLFMGRWQVSVIENLDTVDGVPVTVVVMPRRADWQITPVAPSATAD
jgi:hypothetical protein